MSEQTEQESPAVAASARRRAIERLYDAQPKLFADVRQYQSPQAIHRRLSALHLQIGRFNQLDATSARLRYRGRLCVEYRLLLHKLAMYAHCPIPLQAPWVALYLSERRGEPADKRAHTLILLHTLLIEKSVEQIAATARRMQRMPRNV